MFRRDVQNLADVLNLCLRRNGLETPLLQHRLVNAWDRVVGPGVVAYTGEKFIKNQTTIVDKRMMVPAFLIKDQPLSHMLLNTFPTVGQ